MVPEDLVRFRTMALKQGEHAFLMRLRLEDYPFGPENQFREEWRRGFVTAQGARAFEDGEPESANPYPAGDPLRAVWAEIWQRLQAQAAMV